MKQNNSKERLFEIMSKIDNTFKKTLNEENTSIFDEKDFITWLTNKYRLKSNYLKRVKYVLDGVGDITNDLKDLLYQLELPIFRNNGLTQQNLNKLLYNSIKQIEKENEKYPEMAKYNEERLNKLLFYKKEVKNIDIIIPTESEIGIGKDFFYRVEYDNGKIKVTQEKI